MKTPPTLLALLLLACATGGVAGAAGAAESVVITDRPAPLSASTSATFAFTGTSGVTAFRCELDGAAPSACSSPKTYSGLAQGKHTFTVRGYRGTVDLNISDTYVWTIDSIPPETTITTQVPEKTKAASLTIAFTASEPATFECQLDTAPFQACISPVTVSPGLGKHTFAVRARDQAGNVDSTPATVTWEVTKNLPPVAKIGFLVRPGKPKASQNTLIGDFAVPKGLLGVGNVSLPPGTKLTLSAGKVLLPAGSTIPVVVEGKPYTFSGAASSDADGKVVHYEWSVFDGGGYKKKQEGDSAVFTTSFENVGGWSAVRLVVVDDEGAGGSVEFIVKVDADCVYEVVVGRFRAQADCFRRTVVTDKVVPPAKKGQQSPSLVTVKTTRWTTYPAGYPARVNGITVDPEGKTKKLVTVNLPLIVEQTDGGAVGDPQGLLRVKSPRARVTTPDAQLYLGPVAWTVEPGYIAGFELGGKLVPKLRGLEITGFSGLVPQPALTPSKGAAMKLWVALPKRLGDVTSDEPVPLTVDGGGSAAFRAPASAAGAGDFSFTVENAVISPYFTVRKLKVSYTKASDLWAVQGRVLLDMLGYEAILGLKIQAGSLKEVLASLDNLNLCAAELLCLQKLALHMVLEAKGDSFSGQVGLSLARKVAGASVATVDGTLALAFPAKAPSSIRVSGDVYLFGVVKAGAGFVGVRSDGLVYLGGSVFWGVNGIASVEGKMEGAFKWPKLSVYGKVEACLADVACAGAEAVLSTKALAACLIIDVWFDDWRPGFAYEWGDSLPTIFGASCDVGPYKETFAFARGSSQLPPSGASLLLPGGLPGAVIAVQGATAPPKVTITGPNGEQVSTPVGSGSVRERPFFLIQVPATKTTYVAIGKPQAGTWRVVQQPGSSPVVKILQADGIAPPQVSAKVTGSGEKRALTYSFLPREGQEVVFWEESSAPRGALPEALQLLGTIPSKAQGRRQEGTLGFAPASGAAGARRIVAQVLQNGVPRRRLVVATYSAPPPPPVGATPSVEAVRSGTALTVSWGAAPAATSYRVRLSLADGQRRLYRLGGDTRKLVVRGLPIGVGGTVEVRGLRSSTGTLGPAKSTSVQG